MIYAKVNESFQQVGGSCPNGFIEMQCERPTPRHVAQADGNWVLPAPKEQPNEKIDPSILALAEAVAAQAEIQAAQESRLTKLEGSEKA